MDYLALATDYDGTLATQGRVTQPTLQGLRKWKAANRKLLLVTGRELEDLNQVFPEVDLFDRVIAENGAVLYDPRARSERVLCDPPPMAFIELLRQRGVSPLSQGRVIVATRSPWESQVGAAIRELGLGLQVIMNKGAVMVLPAGVDKETGIHEALRELEIPAREVVAIGDAENDHAFLACCGCAVAVANALPGLRSRADFTTRGAEGEGVRELIDHLLAGCLGQGP